MQIRKSVSSQTRRNWIVDASLFLSAVLVSLSGIYFLFLPSGGYMGGRNPYYGIEIIFERATWDDVHTWSGVAMILIVSIHLPVHWGWFVSMTKRTLKEISGQGQFMSKAGRLNMWLNVLTGLSFFISAASGLYFLLLPLFEFDPGLILSHASWDIIHTWSSVVMILSGVLHFAIHWRWAWKVTVKIMKGIFRRTGDPVDAKKELVYR
jgi:hypothetical protein